jgi:hypothetical protein
VSNALLSASLTVIVTPRAVKVTLVAVLDGRWENACQ